jgi:tight adherence protein B
VIDEVRIRVCTLGEAIPHALFPASNGFGEKASSIFDRSRITWNLTGDFYLVCNLIADELADPKSTTVLQTMVLLHELASTSTESRLARLRDDRSWDLAAAKEAKAAMAGAIFARRFVLVVPIGMALAGAAIGGGRASFQTPAGISLSAIALGLLLLCWIWSTRLIGLPKVKGGRFEDAEAAPDRSPDELVSDRANSSWGR